MDFNISKKASASVLAAALTVSAYAAEISNTTLKWTQRLSGTETSIDNKLIYSYLNSESQWVQVEAGDTIDWASCNILFNNHPDGDYIYAPQTNSITVKNFTMENMSNPTYNWWMSGAAKDITVTDTFTIKSSLNGTPGMVGDSASSFKITAGTLIVDASSSDYATSKLQVNFGGHPGGDRSMGISALHVDNDLTMIGNVLMSWNGRSGGESNPAFYVGGLLKMDSYNGKTPQLYIRWCANSNYSNEIIDGQSVNTGHHSFYVKGLEGAGTITQAAEGMGENAFANFYLNNTGRNDFKGTFTDTGGGLSHYTNFIKRGTGTQVLRVASDTTYLKSIITVEQGDFLLYNFGNQVDVEVKVGARFGAANETYNSATTLEIDSNADLRNLTLKDGAGLLYYADNTSSGGIEWGHSFIAVSGEIFIENEFSIFIEGNAETGDVLTEILSWNETYDQQNTEAIEGAFRDGNVSLFINGTQYNIANLWVSGKVANLEIGEVIPEPAEVAILLGVAAIAVAAYRRRK